MKRLSTFAALIALCVLDASPALTMEPAPRALDRLMRRTRPDGSPAARKVSSRLRAAAQPVGPLAGALVPADPPRSPDGQLRVYVDCSQLGPEQLAALERAGVTIDGVDLERGRVRGSIDAAGLDRVAELAWVRAVRPADPAVVRVGSATTEGDAAARADLVRAQGFDGRGVVVGVISDGIDSLREAQQSGDLSDVTVPDGCPRGRGDEGVALLEIVHDVAPGAELLFAGPADSFEMVQAVECLLAAGAEVIVDDLGFFGEPFFEDGPVAEAVQSVIKGGVSYHSSAGNEAREHLEEDFFPLAGSNGGAHDFGAGAGDFANGVVVPAGGTLSCTLQWNDPFGGSGNDYDLLLLDANFDLIAQSIDPQVGAQDAIERVAVVNLTDIDQLANVVIQRFAGEPRRLELFCLGAAALEHGTAAGSIFGHAALSSVVAVGAVDVRDPGLDDVEAFSSHGPARIDFPTLETRAKPDLVAFDGVAISNAGGFPTCPPFCAFFGTSAAAPHSAGVAALLLHQDPSLTPVQVQEALVRGAVDIGARGFDDATGFGRIDALASAGTSGDSTSTSTTTTSTSSTSTSTIAPPCRGDDECADDDACTVDVCDPVRGCVSAPPAGAGGLTCLLGRLGGADVCGPGEIDERTSALIARRVASAEALVAKAAGASRPAARAAALRKVARRLGTILRRLGRDSSTVSAPCADLLARLVGDARALALELAAS